MAFNYNFLLRIGIIAEISVLIIIMLECYYAE